MKTNLTFPGAALSKTRMMKFIYSPFFNIPKNPVSMKKIFFTFFAVVIFNGINSDAQTIDTSFTETTTAANAATWLKNLQLPSGAGRIGLFNGSMGPLALGQSAINYVDSNSVSALYANTTLFNSVLQTASTNLERYFILARKMGAYMMRAPESFAWGMIEADPGIYNFQLFDTIMKYAGENDIKILGTIIPLADFALTCNNVNPGCYNLMDGGPMYFLNNQRTGAICSSDTVAYKNFVTALVERYDGDGISDMPDLVDPITFYQFHNEPELSCAAIDSVSYVNELRMTYQSIKAACPTCEVMNGGCARATNADSTYWDYVFTNGRNYMDLTSIHVNRPRNEAFDYQIFFDPQYHAIDDVKTLYNKNWDIWMTEWGLYKSSPTPYNPPYISEEVQAARYAKWYAYGLGTDMPVYFYDELGTNDTTNGIATSALLYRNGISNKARLSFYTLKLMESKFRNIDSASVISFQTDVDFSSGHIRVWSTGKTYDYVWGIDSTNLFPYVNGVKQITDIYGNETVQDLNMLTFPLSSLPIIIEDTLNTNSISTIRYNTKVNVFPNPATTTINFQITNGVVGNYQLKIYDLMGKEVRNYEITKTLTEISRENLPNGIYIYSLTDNKQFVSRGKLVLE